MGRSFRSPAKVARRLKLAPLAARKLMSWPRFMCNYAFGLVPEQPYRFRNNARIKIGRGVDHVPIIEIFLREDYGTIEDGAVILDLGANIGIFAVYAAMSARDVTVYAYEPMADFFTLMQENIRLNTLNGAVRCFNAAVAGDAHSRDLFVQGPGLFFPTLVPANQDSMTRKINVACTTLADILDSNELERVDLLKMDCEGAEYEILYGTPRRYFDRVREIRMEYHDRPEKGHNAQALATFLKGAGYDEIIQPAAATAGTGTLWARRHG